MHQKKPHPSEAELLQSIRDTDKWKKIFNGEETLDDSWLSVEQIKEITGLKETQTKFKISKNLKEGLIEKKKICVNVNGRRTMKSFYRLL